MRRRTLLIIILLVIASGITLWIFLGNAEQTKKYTTATVQSGTIKNTVSAVGKIEPSRFVDVGAQVSGQLEKVYIAIGDRVQKAQLLAEIDPTIYRAKLKQAQTDLKNFRAKLAEKKAFLVQIKRQYKRNKQLLSQQLIAPAKEEKTEANYKSALAQVKSLKAQIEQAKATLNIAEANLGYTKIRAPMAGRVVSLSAVARQTLNANQQTPVILRIANMDTMTVTAQVSEADIARLQPGQSVYFTTLGQTREYYGKLSQILPTPTILNDVILYNALFDVKNKDNSLMIDMTAQVFFIVAQSEHTLLIPRSALAYASKVTKQTTRARQVDSTGSQTRRVEQLNPDGTVSAKTITIGVRNATSVEVLCGLKEGDQVITGVASSESNTSGGGLGVSKKGGKR